MLILTLLACWGAPADLDSDNDGLFDRDELRLGTDPHKADSDGDGQSDGVEVHKWGTDPLKMDSDGDGAPDGVEIAALGTDPLTPNPEFMKDEPEPAAPLKPTSAPQPRRQLTPDQPLPPDWRCGPGAVESCFIHIPKGTFAMGAQATDPSSRGHDPKAQHEEGPVHDVTVGPYWMMRFEFGTGMWALCVDRLWCDPNEVADGTGLFNAGTERKGHPINGVTWAGAARACEWLGGRLPTEAEWEYAARGAHGERWPWGPLRQCGVMPYRSNADGSGLTLNDGQELDECVNDGTAPNGRLRGPSPFGVMGMAASVWEWVSDGYAPDAYARHTPEQPVGPVDAAMRVIRGGGWTNLDPYELRSAARGSMRPDQKMPDVGFRCVRDVQGDAP